VEELPVEVVLVYVEVEVPVLVADVDVEVDEVLVAILKFACSAIGLLRIMKVDGDVPE
jgi:hypothetical protein